MAGNKSFAHSGLKPSIALVIGGVLWGVFWIPLREIGSSGVTGVWPGLFVYIGVALCLLPVIALRPNLIRSPWRALLWCGLFTGTAFSLYSISLFLTDVVRVLLLFYMTPVWGTLLGVFLLGEKITPGRTVALVLGVAGLAVVLGIGTQFPWPKNLGDWLALGSGIAWAYGSLCIYRLENSGTFEQAFVFVLGSIAISVVALVMGGPVISAPISFKEVFSAAPMIVFTTLFIIPMLFLTLWPASVLSPGRVGLLLMSEAIVGILSAAWLTGEPFGQREIVGSILIVGAGFVEVLSPAAPSD